MKLRDYLASDEFQKKSLEEKQTWLSGSVKGFDALPMAEKRKLYTGFGAKPESFKTKVQLADQALTNAIPAGKLIQDVGMQTLGAVAGGAGGALAAPFTGPAAPAMPFIGERMGEGAGQAFSDFAHGASGKESAKDLYKTPAMNAALMGGMKGVGKLAGKMLPGYAKAVMKIEEPFSKEMLKTGGRLPKATQEASTQTYTKVLKEATGSTMEPGEELEKLANQFEGKFGGAKVPPEVAAAKKQVEALKPLLEKQYPGLFDMKNPDAVSLRNAVRKAGVGIPPEDVLKKLGEIPEKPVKGLPSKIPISPRGATADQEEQVAYHLRRLKGQMAESGAKDEAAQKPFVAELYRLRRWIDNLRNYGGEEVKDAKSLQKSFKTRMDTARQTVQQLLGDLPGGQAIQGADKQLVAEKAGRAYGRFMPEGRGSMYHLGAAFSPFLLYHLGVPFLPATALASLLSSPRAAQAAFKYAPKLAPTAARAAGVGLKDVFQGDAQ